MAKQILIVAENSRGKDVRISTNENAMPVKVYFQNADKEIRSTTVIFYLTRDGMLNVKLEDLTPSATVGRPDEKLDPVA
jgi:hypothetical protein